MAIYLLEEPSLEQYLLPRVKLLPQCGACLYLKQCGQATAALRDLLV